ncbi:hypothetical protein EKD16_20870 [Streptomonospora litoralis]|uniref:Uncharacterized protein n=1 Tax=Streptomonospora litoralis TaxID=2498135 RepID=A0A4P6Q5L5_9ACTN|nr:hypothetical protein EKD16_20870 [Streptomonospora litoralis]
MWVRRLLIRGTRVSTRRRLVRRLLVRRAGVGARLRAAGMLLGGPRARCRGVPAAGGCARARRLLVLRALAGSLGQAGALLLRRALRSRGTVVARMARLPGLAARPGLLGVGLLGMGRLRGRARACGRRIRRLLVPSLLGAGAGCRGRLSPGCGGLLRVGRLGAARSGLAGLVGWLLVPSLLGAGAGCRGWLSSGCGGLLGVGLLGMGRLRGRARACGRRIRRLLVPPLLGAGAGRRGRLPSRRGGLLRLAGRHGARLGLLSACARRLGGRGATGRRLLLGRVGLLGAGRGRLSRARRRILRYRRILATRSPRGGVRGLVVAGPRVLRGGLRPGGPGVRGRLRRAAGGPGVARLRAGGAGVSGLLRCGGRRAARRRRGLGLCAAGRGLGSTAEEVSAVRGRRVLRLLRAGGCGGVFRGVRVRGCVPRLGSAVRAASAVVRLIRMRCDGGTPETVLGRRMGVEGGGGLSRVRPVAGRRSAARSLPGGRRSTAGSGGEPPLRRCRRSYRRFRWLPRRAASGHARRSAGRRCGPEDNLSRPRRAAPPGGAPAARGAADDCSATWGGRRV